MKANHQQLYMILFVVALLGLLFSTIVHAVTIFVTCPGGLFGIMVIIGSKYKYGILLK